MPRLAFRQKHQLENRQLGVADEDEELEDDDYDEREDSDNPDADEEIVERSPSPPLPPLDSDAADNLPPVS